MQKSINRGVQITTYEGGANKARRRREGVNFLFQKLIYNIKRPCPFVRQECNFLLFEETLFMSHDDFSVSDLTDRHETLSSLKIAQTAEKCSEDFRAILET